MFNFSDKVQMVQGLGITDQVEELLKSLPEDAHSLTLIVESSLLLGSIENASLPTSLGNLKIVFQYNKSYLPGAMTLQVGYGQGIFESANFKFEG